MEGIRFVERYGDLWEDIYDQILVRKRKAEKREPVDAVEKRLVKNGRLRG